MKYRCVSLYMTRRLCDSEGLSSAQLSLLTYYVKYNNVVPVQHHAAVGPTVLSMCRGETEDFCYVIVFILLLCHFLRTTENTMIAFEVTLFERARSYLLNSPLRLETHTEETEFLN